MDLDFPFVYPPGLPLRLLRNLSHQLLLAKLYQKKENLKFFDTMFRENPVQNFPELVYELTGRNLV